MRLALSSIAIAMIAATPALAGEARVEARGGVDWTDGQTAKATAGAAVGYDVDVGGSAFIGAEQSADKVLEGGTNVRFGSSGRIGIKASPNDKIYATGGYNYGKGPNGADVGAGWEHSFGGLYGKVEYKRFFNEDAAPNSNAAMVGLGVKF